MVARKPVVIITGASRGIGLAVTRYLLKAPFNANVVALSRSQTTDLVESDNLLIINCDIANEVALTEAIRRAKERYHHIDGLILNAGTVEPLCRVGDDTPLSAWKQHFDVNFFSLVTALKAALPSLRESELGGKVVFVSSGAAVSGSTGWGPYSAAKAAMNSLCRTLADEEPKVISIALRPGMVDTEMQAMLRSDLASPHLSAEGQQKFIAAHRDGKLVKPEDAGHVIASLAIQASKELNGQFVTWDSEQCIPHRKK